MTRAGTSRAARVAGAILGLSVFSGSAFAATYEIDPMHSSVGFRIRHLVGRVNGSFTRFEGTLEFDEKQPARSAVKTSIEAGSVNTQNAKRDEHLRSPEFFDAARYPGLTFTSKKVTPRGRSRFRVSGDLTLHGVTRPVVLDAVYSGQTTDPMGMARVGFQGSTRINRKDFGIVWNKLMDKGGAMLGDDVEITLEVEGVLKK